MPDTDNYLLPSQSETIVINLFRGERGDTGEAGVIGFTGPKGDKGDIGDSSLNIFPYPTSDSSAANKKYVDDLEARLRLLINPPPPDIYSGWVNIPGGQTYINYESDLQKISNRYGGEGNPFYDFTANVIEAHIIGDNIIWKTPDEYKDWRFNQGTGGSISESDYNLLRSDPNAHRLT